MSGSNDDTAVWPAAEARLVLSWKPVTLIRVGGRVAGIALRRETGMVVA